jgi:RNA polymerase sigma factor (TIGR02999 family)
MKLNGARKIVWQSRAHFIAIAARAMRQVLVEYARRHGRVKRLGEKVPLEDALVFTEERSTELLALDEALDRLSAIHPRMAQVAELRFFGGLDNREIGDLLKISPNTVMRDWNFAKAWLLKETKGGQKSR